MTDRRKDGTVRRFQLVREQDVSGISGTGIVAEGVVFTDGTTVVRWLKAGTARPDVVEPTTVLHPDIANVLALHGHGGSSWVSWLDQAPPPTVNVELP